MGSVVASVELDRRLTQRIAAAVHLPAGDRLVFRSGPPVPSPSTVRVAGIDYRAAAVRLAGEGRPASLVVLAPRSRVAADAAAARNRVLLVGLITLGAVALLGYAFAPTIARGRTIRQQRDQAAQVLLHLGEGVFLVDDDGVVKLWNQAAETITGLRAESVVGEPVAAVLPDWPSIRDAVGGGPQTVTLAVAIGGRELWLSISGVTFNEGTAIAFRDLTETRRLEQMRSDFVATVSHELRTPLASIRGAALTLTARGRELEPALHDRLMGIVADQSERLSELVGQILLAAQLDSGGLQYVAERFDAEELARNVVDSVQPRLPPGLTVTLSAASAPYALGDPDKTRRILANLIDNAVKYSPAGGRIEVIVARRGERLRVTVRDEGLGIPPGEQERIFEKFYRLDAAMSRGVGGSGLGLYICRELAQGMDGEIWASSRPGGGSDFCLELPLAEPRAAIA